MAKISILLHIFKNLLVNMIFIIVEVEESSDDDYIQYGSDGDKLSKPIFLTDYLDAIR